MADKSQLKILRQGVAAWNEWRPKDVDDIPEVDLSEANLFRANLSGADLIKANLSGANLSEANLSGARFSGAKLSWADLSGADLIKANLSGANLSEARLSRANLSRANLSEANFSWANLSETDLIKATLSGANLSWARLSRANLSGTDLSQANLDRTNLSGANLNEANLSGANLSGANLNRANLDRTNLSGANLSQTDLSGADLIKANLSGANLSETDLIKADLSEASLGWAYLSKAKLNECNFERASFYETILSNVDLSRCKGLELISHRGPSSIEIRTLRRSGPLPLVFLRGAGLPDKLIDYLPSLLNQTIKFYECFISYSAKDEEFVRRLHADLQDKGVRCWFAPEDMKIGAKILDTLDQAIRLHDKVLLVLSEASIASDWVEDEVTKGFAEERQRGTTVLFPVRIDDAVFATNEAWAVKLRDNRNIGDFRNWKDHDAYQKTLTRLLRDLRIEPP